MRVRQHSDEAAQAADDHVSEHGAGRSRQDVYNEVTADRGEPPQARNVAVFNPLTRPCVRVVTVDNIPFLEVRAATEEAAERRAWWLAERLEQLPEDM